MVDPALDGEVEPVGRDDGVVAVRARDTCRRRACCNRRRGSRSTGGGGTTRRDPGGVLVDGQPVSRAAELGGVVGAEHVAVAWVGDSGARSQAVAAVACECQLCLSDSTAVKDDSHSLPYSVPKY